MFVSIRSRFHHVVAIWLAMLSLMLATLAGGATVAAQDGDFGILLRAWACPNGSPADVWEECEGIVGAVYQVEVDGEEIAESPVTTVRETGVSHGVFFTVPASGVTITVTQMSGAPDGYAPAPGYAPFTANIADLPDVGMGGESYGPGITIVNELIDDGDANTDDDDESNNVDDGASTDDDTSGGDGDAGTGDGSGEVSELPRTGAGAMAPDTSAQAAPIALLLIAASLAGAGLVTRRARTR